MAALPPLPASGAKLHCALANDEQTDVSEALWHARTVSNDVSSTTGPHGAHAALSHSSVSNAAAPHPVGDESPETNAMHPPAFIDTTLSNVTSGPSVVDDVELMQALQAALSVAHVVHVLASSAKQFA
jgi:hypothetical protein